MIFKRQDNDPFFNNVSLLLHMDGVNGSTTFTDSSKNNFQLTAFGNAQISTSVKKYGDGSAYFDGIGDYLDLPVNAIQFNADDFTIEFWVYPTRTGSHTCVANWGCNSNMTIFFAVETNSGAVVYLNGDGPYITGGSIQTNQWQHVALVRQGSNMRAYINGVQAGSTYNIGNTAINTIVDNIRIGRDTANFYCNQPLEGYMNDLRITTGVARYTGNFTPPTAPFPDRRELKRTIFKKNGSNKIIFKKPIAQVFDPFTTVVSGPTSFSYGILGNTNALNQARYDPSQNRIVYYRHPGCGDCVMIYYDLLSNKFYFKDSATIYSKEPSSTLTTDNWSRIPDNVIVNINSSGPTVNILPPG